MVVLLKRAIIDERRAYKIMGITCIDMPGDLRMGMMSKHCKIYELIKDSDGTVIGLKFFVFMSPKQEGDLPGYEEQVSYKVGDIIDETRLIDLQADIDYKPYVRRYMEETRSNKKWGGKIILHSSDSLLVEKP